MKCLRQLVLLVLFILFITGIHTNSYAYISVDSGDMAQAIVNAITDNASIFQQNNQSNASNSLSYYEQAIENIDKVELATAINKFLDKIQTASGDISFNDISMYVYIQNSSYTSYPLQLRIIYSSFDSNSEVTRYTIYANNDGSGFEISPYDTNKGFLYQDIQITPQGKVYGLSWSSFTPLIRKTSIYQYRFPAVNNVNIEERTGGLYYKPLISFGTSQFITLNNGGDIYGLNLNKLNFSDSGGITPTPSGDTPSGDVPSGDTPSGDVPSGDTPSGEQSGDTQSGENLAGYWGSPNDLDGEQQEGEIENAINEITENISGEIASGEALQGINELEDNLINTLNYGKDNPQLLDLIIKWPDIKYSGETIIKSGDINFSKLCREDETLGTIQIYIRTIACFQIAWALIIQIYNLTLATLGIDNPYLYENEDSVNTTTFEDEFGNGYEDTIIRDRRGNREIYRQSVTRAKPGRQIGFRKD